MSCLDEENEIGNFNRGEINEQGGLYFVLVH